MTENSFRGKKVRAIFIGPPGSGKGTQASIFFQRFGVTHLSTGDLIQAEIAAGSELGKEMRQYFESGKFVPDRLICRLIETHMERANSQRGFLLDGFPRTIAQANMLDEMLEKRQIHIDAVVEFGIDDELLIGRITGRLVHTNSGRVYHEESIPPKVPMIDDVTGEALMRRTDDNAKTLMKRMTRYHHYTKPLIGYYQMRNVHTRIDASAQVDDVAKMIEMHILENIVLQQ